MKVVYFARLRESVGLSEEIIEKPVDVNTAGELKDWLAARGEPFQSALSGARVLMAVDQEHAQADSDISTCSEVAFFPPVTGG
ncbi:molybdopterin converting factor subunit 1 [Litoribacillus peritrichatus]|uniref:Molybdopterin synthase sulfur carrier subunit n=1 Tax=Litoribacillus peritrichatus TaxID=718191 RepID=A0ABP7MZG8_9GAMM